MKIKNFILVFFLFFIIIPISYSLTQKVSSFVNQTNPFNITFVGGDNHTYYLSLPRYSYFLNLSLDLEEFGVISSYISLTTWTSYRESNWAPNFNNIKDENWLTEAHYDSGSSSTAWFNYTIPTSYVTVLLEVKDEGGTVNLSISSNFSDCIYNNIMAFRVASIDTPRVDWSCYNFTSGDFVLMRRDITGNQAYEQELFYTTNAVNTKLFISDSDWSFSEESAEYNLSANITVLNNILWDSCTCSGCSIIGNNCSIPITAYSLDSKTLQINLSNATYLYGVDDLNYIRVVDNLTGLPIENMTVSITYPFGTQINKTSNADGYINFSSLYNGTFQWGTFTFEMTKIGYLKSQTFTENLNYSNLPINITYSLNPASIYVRLFDRETETLITKPATLSIVGVANYSTTNGTIHISDVSLVPRQYIAIATATGYITEQTTFTFSNQDNISLDIYLFNATSENIGSLIVQVYDDFYNLITGANTKLLEYRPVDNSFVEVAQCYTNTNGECIFSVELNTKFYIVQSSIVINNRLYTAQSTDTGELVKLDNSIIGLHLKTTEGFQVDELFDLVITPSNTSLVGNTSYLTATFSDYSNIDHTVCIAYYIRDGLNEILVAGPTCVTGSAGIVNYAGGYSLDRSYTYVAKIYVVDSYGKKVTYYSYNYEALAGSLADAFGIYLKPLILFLLLCLLAVSIYLKNIQIFAIGSIPLSLLTLVWLPNLIGGITVTFIIIIDICIIYLSRKREEY